MSQKYGFRGRIGFPAHKDGKDPDTRPQNSLAARWGSLDVFEEGFVGIPTAFFRYYSHLKLSQSEAMFILHLMSFKWNENAPFPSYPTLAQRMGITTEMARRHAKRIEEKNLLKRIRRTGKSNAFDLRPLTHALVQVLRDQGASVKSAA